ncbi:Hypothetical predicted protein [Olea europaea subsp. europaea]|uniref:Uncharacterized protein n=1 Tax=Olea europaea subsp. europaea TaxID=158383 RepID=A0A8S0RSD0_OLEEU|nr:Hypothetical predicted protein [Olea europaea subsp. europaea]
MTSAGPIASADNSWGGKSIQQGIYFLEAAKSTVGGDFSMSPPLQLRKPAMIEGDLGFIFMEAKVKHLVEEFRFALILKFLSYRPNIDLTRAAIAKNWGLRVMPVVSSMDSSHVLVQMKNEGDFLRARQRRKIVVTAGPEKQAWRRKNGDMASDAGIEKQHMQEGGGMTTLHAINKTKVGESSMAYNLDVDNNKENKDRMEMELARDKNMDEDRIVASKTNGSNPVMHGGDNPVKPVGGSYLVDGEQAREEGEIEEREANLNEDLLVTIDNNEQINAMATHIMERTEDDEGVKEIDEEIQEETREHGIAEVDTIISVQRWKVLWMN